MFRIPAVWGYRSVVFEDDVTDWSGKGTMCRIYLTAALGVLHPLAAIFALACFRSTTVNPLDIRCVRWVQD